MERIDLTPNWETAVKIYIEALENNNASEEGKQGAREELIYLARYVDNMRLEKSLKQLKDPRQLYPDPSYKPSIADYLPMVYVAVAVMTVAFVAM